MWNRISLFAQLYSREGVPQSMPEFAGDKGLWRQLAGFQTLTDSGLSTQTFLLTYGLLPGVAPEKVIGDVTMRGIS